MKAADLLRPGTQNSSCYRNCLSSAALILCAGDQTRTAPLPPPGRCRPHAQQSAPLTGSRLLDRESSEPENNQLSPCLARAASSRLMWSSTIL
jgi:hypothetical protein